MTLGGVRFFMTCRLVALLFAAGASITACKTAHSSRSAVKDIGDVGGTQGMCTVTCDDGQKYSASGAQSMCNSNQVQSLFDAANQGFPTCFQAGAPQFLAGATTRGIAAQGTCTVTCDNGQTYSAPGAQSMCNINQVQSLFAAANKGFPTCFQLVAPKFQAGAASGGGVQGTCTVTCDNGQRYSAKGPQSRCNSSQVQSLFDAANKGFPTCFQLGPPKFQAN